MRSQDAARRLLYMVIKQKQDAELKELRNATNDENWQTATECCTRLWALSVVDDAVSQVPGKKLGLQRIAKVLHLLSVSAAKEVEPRYAGVQAARVAIAKELQHLLVAHSA